MKIAFAYDGKAVDYTPDRDVEAGELIIEGKLVGITHLPISSGELGALHIVGVYGFATQNTSFEIGDEVFINQNRSDFVHADDSDADIKIGVCVRESRTQWGRFLFMLNPLGDSSGDSGGTVPDGVFVKLSNSTQQTINSDIGLAKDKRFFAIDKDGINHEMLGINKYTVNGTEYNQTEINSELKLPLCLNFGVVPGWNDDNHILVNYKDANNVNKADKVAMLSDIEDQATETWVKSYVEGETGVYVGKAATKSDLLNENWIAGTQPNTSHVLSANDWAYVEADESNEGKSASYIFDGTNWGLGILYSVGDGDAAEVVTDNTTIGLNEQGELEVKDEGITEAKLSTSLSNSINGKLNTPNGNPDTQRLNGIGQPVDDFKNKTNLQVVDVWWNNQAADDNGDGWTQATAVKSVDHIKSVVASLNTTGKYAIRINLVGTASYGNFIFGKSVESETAACFPVGTYILALPDGGTVGGITVLSGVYLNYQSIDGESTDTINSGQILTYGGGYINFGSEASVSAAGIGVYGGGFITFGNAAAVISTGQIRVYGGGYINFANAGTNTATRNIRASSYSIYNGGFIYVGDRTFGTPTGTPGTITVTTQTNQTST